MSDQQPAAGTTDVVVPEPVEQTAQAAAPVPVAAPPQARTTDDPPPWLGDRLKQARAAERKELLSQFGVESSDALAQKLSQLKELELAQLSEKERAEKLIQELTPKAAKLDAVQAQFAEVVNAQLAQVPEQVRASIEAAAGSDAQERWRLMQVMNQAGVLTAVPTAAPAPKPATTTPAQQPPTPTAPSNAQTEWDRIKYQPGIDDPLVGAASVEGQLHYIFNSDSIGRDPSQG